MSAAQPAAAVDGVTGAAAGARPDRPPRVPWLAVVAYVVVAFGLAWLVTLPLWLGGGLTASFAGVLLIAMMFTPTIGALVAVFLVQRPRPRSVPEYLGMWPLRPAWRLIGLSLAGIFGSILVSVAAVFLAAAFGAVRLDLTGFSGFSELLHSQLAAAGVQQELPLPIGVLVLVQLLTIPFGALINSVATVGEELGWRGWLLPSLRPLGTWPALLISGALWGLWHSPIILLGYNFGEPNLLGVLLMTLGCTAYGVLIGWLRLRSGSVWPAVFAHGAFNASAGVGALLLAAGSPASPAALLPLGWTGWIVCTAIAVVLVLCGQFRRQPTLVRRAPLPAR
ncbi:abortive infection protein [Leifsonia sp. LS1]|uniref:CPBP family intramembrane glutamic endopeptidase n=1 Tax=Leifsonia sp. LS1 TaxID=2828483 RepID=UPI001CFDFCF1|nr:type II CAAX endopeptidase family protein [Leifsonia sp. LS1]GIT78650.1 abortive infection protein [Leifsonia sp. LS1]